MYCPQCKAEYRQGFTRCADCDVELVHELPTGAQGWGATGESSSHAEDAEDPFCSFWRGDDPRIHAELCELLNEEGIPHRTLRREDRSEEHTSELQSHSDLVCRLLLEKKKKINTRNNARITST